MSVTKHKHPIGWVVLAVVVCLLWKPVVEIGTFMGFFPHHYKAQQGVPEEAKGMTDWFNVGNELLTDVYYYSGNHLRATTTFVQRPVTPPRGAPSKRSWHTVGPSWHPRHTTLGRLRRGA